MSSIRLVCFDLGGVVIRICRSWAEGCAAAGLDVRDESRRQLSREARRELIVRHQTGRLGGQEFAQLVSRAQDGLYSPQEILAVHHAWITGEYEGVGDLIDAINQRNVSTAALSNTNHEHWRQMREFPTMLRFRHLFASHLLGLHKPDAAIFHAVQRQLGLAGDEILFFDDLAENIDGARSAGWHAHAIDPLAPTAPQITAALRTHGVLE